MFSGENKTFEKEPKRCFSKTKAQEVQADQTLPIGSREYWIHWIILKTILCLSLFDLGQTQGMGMFHIYFAPKSTGPSLIKISISAQV